ncbi:adenylate cyclase, terminal-differentiation specific-like [Saccostrea echinata]|uniref:adenylate cyclase, terminal-differentiation specific-like n=1 Tax=Saccostrea echinata TaxID=191078 RepID=UPI002A80615E|nr:adenylate cyclase, terminal-differentiation specific-like [Saccostrea echinata]
MKKSRTTPYHAMGNGQCERYNRTLLNMLGTLKPSQKQNWKLYINPLVHAYNCIKNESTGVSPYFLMFGREPKLPIDIEFGLKKEEKKSVSKYISNLKENMKAAYELVSKITKKSQERQKESYDRKTTNAEIQIGDRVLVKIVAFDGKHKIADKWEEEPYLVIDQPNLEIPVYKVQKETSKGKTRTLHRNLLLPIGHLDSYEANLEESSTSLSKPTPKPRTRQTWKKQEQVQEKTPETKELEDERDVSSDEESVIEFIPVPVPRIPEVNVPEDVGKHSGKQRVQRSKDQTVQSPREQRVQSPIEQTVQSPREQTVDQREQRQERKAEEEIQHHDAEENATQQQPVQIEAEQQQEHAVADTSPRSEDKEQEPEPMLPRRSTRERRKPDWLNPQEYVLAQQQHQDEWMKKCDYLHRLKAASEMKSYENDIVQTMLDILKKS